MKLGRLIVFEGVEGGGKTTQLQLVQVWLAQSGWRAKLAQAFPTLADPILVTREPGGTVLGQQLRQILLDPTHVDPLSDRTELLLYAADRAQHVAAKLIPHLMAGGLVLCDRFTDSTVAYQGYGRGLDLQVIEQLNQIATAGLKSDLTFWLDLPVSEGLARARVRNPGGGLDRIESIDLTFHERVRQGFLQLHQAAPQQRLKLDATQPTTVLAEQIQQVLEQHLCQWYPQPTPV